MKSFCPHCGTQMIYAGAKPNFCSSCGESLNSFSVAHEKKAQPEREEDEDGVPNVPEVNYVPNINNLDVDIKMPNPQSQTLGQVLENYSNVEPSQNSPSNKTSNTPKVSRKQFLDDFKKEAGGYSRKKK